MTNQPRPSAKNVFIIIFLIWVFCWTGAKSYFFSEKLLFTSPFVCYIALNVQSELDVYLFRHAGHHVFALHIHPEYNTERTLKLNLLQRNRNIFAWL